MSFDPVTRSRLLTIGKFGLAVALIVAILSAVDGREAWRMLRSADPAWLLLAFALLSLQTVLSAVRWRLTARTSWRGRASPSASAP